MPATRSPIAPRINHGFFLCRSSPDNLRGVKSVRRMVYSQLMEGPTSSPVARRAATNLFFTPDSPKASRSGRLPRVKPPAKAETDGINGGSGIEKARSLLRQAETRRNQKWDGFSLAILRGRVYPSSCRGDRKPLAARPQLGPWKHLPARATGRAVKVKRRKSGRYFGSSWNAGRISKNRV